MSNVELVHVIVLPDGRLDRKNAAKYLGLSPKTLATLESRGKGPKAIKLGRVFYFRQDLDAWIRNGGKRRGSGVDSDGRDQD